MTTRTRIKICGVCRVADALLAARAGADAIGLLFHEASPRSITVERAREILAALPPFVTPVGLFVNAGTGLVMERALDLGLRHVQLHGDETADDVLSLSPLRVVKALRVESGRFPVVLKTWRESIAASGLANLAGFVLETAGTAAPGGTGVANDWETVRDAQQAGAFAGLPPIIAAGGLRPETVGDVVRTIRPYAVDVSSGVEETRGCKSGEKLRAFVTAVRQADAER